MNRLNKLITVMAAKQSISDALNVFDIDQATSQILEGDQADLTLDKNGNFKHPFYEQPHLETIHYLDSGTFSVKLN